MKLISLIARRFVLDRKSLGRQSSSKGFVSFISSISVFGLALGVTALLVVTSVVNGFEHEMKNALTSFHGHILLFSKSEPIDHPEKMVEEIRREFPSVTAISPYFFIEAMLGAHGALAGTVVEGIDTATIDSVSKIRDKLLSGRLPEPGADFEIALGSEIAARLKVKAGDEVVLMIPFAGAQGHAQDGTTADSSFSNAPLLKKLKVTGIVKLGMYEYDNKYSVMEIGKVGSLIGSAGKANAFKILTNDMMKSAAVTNAMNDKYTYPLRARDWSSLNSNLFYSIELEKVVIAIVLMAIVLVASFNVVSTILMLVNDKKKQISMLKALGFSQMRTLAVFLLLGAGMAVSGVFGGLIFGRSLVEFLRWNSIIDLPADVYGLSRLPVEIRPHEWVYICVMVVVLALLAAYLPSLRMSRQSPAEGIRHE